MPWVCISTPRASWPRLATPASVTQGGTLDISELAILLAALLVEKIENNYIPIKIRDWDGRGSA